MDGPCHQFCGQFFGEIGCFVDTEWIDGHSHSFCGQAGRDGEVFSRREPRKTSLFVRLFPGGAENNLYIIDYGCWWHGCGKGLGWGYFPSSSRSSFGGSCCCPRITPPDLPAQTVPQKNPSGPAGPNNAAEKPLRTCQPKLSRRKSLRGFLQCALGSVTWQVRKFHESWVNWNSPYLY